MSAMRGRTSIRVSDLAKRDRRLPADVVVRMLQQGDERPNGRVADLRERFCRFPPSPLYSLRVIAEISGATPFSSPRSPSASAAWYCTLGILVPEGEGETGNISFLFQFPDVRAEEAEET